MAWVLPVGGDFADGVTLLPVQPTGTGGTPRIVGTPLPTAFIQIWGNAIPEEEQPGSPRLERAEQTTCEHKIEMQYTQGYFYWSVMPRGTVVTDTSGNIWKILSCDLTRTSGTMSDFSYVMEAISFDSPPDTFDIQNVSLDLNIIKHPRYWPFLSPYAVDDSTYVLIGDTQVFYTAVKEAIIRMIQNYIDSPFYPSETQVQGRIQTNILSMVSLLPGSNNGILQIHYPNSKYDGSKKTVPPVPWDGTNANLPTANCVYFALAVTVNLNDPTDPLTIALAAAREIISKLWRQEDTPLIEGKEVIWRQNFYQPVYLNPGGYTEDPRAFVPSYFLTPGVIGPVIPRGITGSGGGAGDTVNPVSFVNGQYGPTIFDQFPIANPQSYSADGTAQGELIMSSLRKADSDSYDRTIYTITHSWLVAPVGKWDEDLYPEFGVDGPQDANSFNQHPQDRTDL